MNTIEKRQKRAQIVKEMREILDLAEQEKRELSAEERQKYDAMDKDVDRMGDEIQREERLLGLETDLRGTGDNPFKADPGAGADKAVRDEQRKVAFRQWLCGGSAGLTSEQRSLMAEYRAQSAVTGTAGGYTVPQGFYGQIVDAMKFFGGMRQSNATIMNTAGGNDIPIPTCDDSVNEGELVGENTPVASQDLTFDQVTLKAFKFSSKTVLIPFELLQDSGVDIEAFISKKLGERLGRSTNKYFTTGTGTSQPQGVVAGATLGKTGVTGQTTSIIYDDLVDLIHTVDPAYRQAGKCQFMFHDDTLKALKKLKDGQGRPLWLPGIAVKEPDTISGYSYIINNNVATMAASAKSMLFGDFSTYFIRNVMDIQLYRIVDKYIEAGQVGFLAYYRGDGRCVDAGTHPIAYYANAAS